MSRRGRREAAAAAGSIDWVSEAATLAGLDLRASGKVRDIYAFDDLLLLVASDRISAYDVVLPTPIPDKGAVLTGMSVWWFGRTEDIVPNHLITADVNELPDAARAHANELRGRAMLCRKLEMLPVECVVRGYLAGSGWRDYQSEGSICGIELPAGLTESEALPEPIFTPATKADVGEHDENIDAASAAERLGSAELFEDLRRISIDLYERASRHARERGIILADTKFEFGTDRKGRLVLADEIFTPDSSRFWPADTYEPGRSQPSYDKQYVRDWLDQSGWDHSPPGPDLPTEVVANTRAKYIQAYEEITGEPFARWRGESS